MAKSGRKRKPVAQREPNGRVSRAVAAFTRPIDPTAAYRARENAVLQARQPEWGTVIGAWYMAGKISASQFEAAKRYAGLASAFMKLKGYPQPRSGLAAIIGPSSGSGRDPDPALVAACADAFMEARQVIRGASMIGEAIVDRAVILNQHDAPSLPVLVLCLNALVAHWGTQRSR